MIASQRSLWAVGLMDLPKTTLEMEMSITEVQPQYHLLAVKSKSYPLLPPHVSISPSFVEISIWGTMHISGSVDLRYNTREKQHTTICCWVVLRQKRTSQVSQASRLPHARCG